MKMSKKILTVITLIVSVFVFAVCSMADSVSFESGDYAFSVNNDGETVTLTKYLGNDESVSIPQTVEYDGKIYTVDKIGAAFSGCENVKKISIPESITVIGDSAFSSCYDLTEISISYGVTYIGNFAFFGCEKLTEISLPESVTYIGSWVFTDCTGLREVYIPDGITSIGDNSFSYCTSLTKISLPDSITSIGNYAFYSCYSLDEISIPDNVVTIGNNAFNYCYSLTELSIPDSVESIGHDAFRTCYSLNFVYFYGDVPEVWGGNVFPLIPESDLVIRYIEGKKGWTSSIWIANDGAAYKTSIFKDAEIGDINADGKIDLDDVIVLLRHISKSAIITDPKVLEFCDIVDDGFIDMDDVIRLLRYVSKAIPSLR